MSDTLIYVAQPIGTRITVLAFRKRFTLEERVALEKRAREDAMIRVFLDDVAAATYIDLTDSDLRECLEAAAILGVLEVTRVDEILDKSVRSEELPE
jgi:hypothetical protein